MNEHHHLTDVRLDTDNLYLTVDGEPKIFSLKKISSRLAKASEKERTVFEISPSGYGIHWPLIDEDISIDGLLGIIHQPSKVKISVRKRSPV
jgi:hypothetical protein